jgi:four helix bundle protein
MRVDRESRFVNRESGSTFEDLEVYQAARDFRRAMYAIARELPEIEKFGLVNQIRRASVSLTSNIAEGHGRFHFPDQIKFTLQARGSLEELIDDLNVCADECYLAADHLSSLKQQAWPVRQLIDGYIRYLRAQIKTKDSSVREESSRYGEGADLDPIHDSRCNDSR